MIVPTFRALLAGPVALAVLAALLRPTPAQATTYSLAGDFSYTENRTDSTWSYRLDDRSHDPPTFPLLTLSGRNANEIWGSDFPTPPMMWSEESGYWGIGRNSTGEEQFSSRNNTHWAPGEVLLHPRVFANDKQYLAIRVYPGREDSVGVSLSARGQDAVLESLDAWQMNAIWPVQDIGREDLEQ